MGEKKVAFINGLKVPEGSKIPGDCSTRVGKELKMGVLSVTNANREKRWISHGVLRADAV